MIKLEDFSDEIRYSLVRGCEPFFIQFKSPKWQMSLVNSLCEELGLKYRKEVKVILTASSKAKRYNLTGSQFSLSKSVYVTAKRRTGQSISLIRMKELLTLMEDLDYLTVLLGYHKPNGEGIRTCLRFHDKLLSRLKKKHCLKWGLSRTEGIEFLEIVDTDKSTKKNKVFKSLKSVKGTGECKQEIIDINTVMGVNIITFRDEPCVVMYKRRFEGDLYNAGRLYTIGTFQTEASEWRHTIKINGEETVEVDVCSIHPSIMASLLGIKLSDNFDPYDINYILGFKGDLVYLRSFLKVYTMCLFYAKHRGSALYEIRTKLKSDKVLKGKLSEKDILEALEEHNYTLHTFYYNKEQWKMNQYLDSSIIIKVMKHFTDKGIVSLSYHDSVRVQVKHLDELLSVMRESWVSVIGDDDNFRYKIND